jgi:hypothetical protein
MGVNLDIINAIGVPDPRDLHAQGRWDWDAMLNIMRTATGDTDGDGLTDRWGVAGQPGDFTTYLIGANDGRTVSDDFRYYFDHPNTVEALEFVEIIFREGLWEVDPALGLDTGDWSRNFWAFDQGNSALWFSRTWALHGGDLPFEFAVVPVPTGPSNTSGNTWMMGWPQSHTIVAGSSWDPADVLMIMEELWAWPGEELDLLVDGALDWPRGILPTEQCVQNQVNAMSTVNVEVGINVPQYIWVTGSFVQAFVDQSMTVMQAIEYHRGPRQEMLDEFFR